LVRLITRHAHEGKQREKKPCLVKTWDSSYLAESLESCQGTFFSGLPAVAVGLIAKFGFGGRLPLLLRLSMGVGFF
jgi:hypothetical protein